MTLASVVLLGVLSLLVFLGVKEHNQCKRMIKVLAVFVTVCLPIPGTDSWLCNGEVVTKEQRIEVRHG